MTQLSNFIDRSIGLSVVADVQFQFDWVAFTLSRKHGERSIATTISYDSLEFEWRQPDIARVFSQFSAVLCTVVHLTLEARLDEVDHSDDAYDIEWLHLLRLFPAMQTLYVDEELAPAVALALENVTAETVAEVLPSLGFIFLDGEPVSSLEKIVAIRRFSGRPITVVETREKFNDIVESYI